MVFIHIELSGGLGSQDIRPHPDYIDEPFEER